MNHARIAAGIPETNSALYWRIRFCVGDPVALIELPVDGGTESILILRDIEMGRARRIARVDRVACPADFTPAQGLSGDRETATAQAAAECIRRAGVTAAIADRSLPMLFADLIRSAGVGVECDPEMWVSERRRKTATEIDHIREPPLLDAGGPELLAGDVVTIEPGLYRRDLGGMRVEDIVVVTEAGCESLNRLPEGLDWR